jgi:predicted protein tyrosine phosphatase
MKDTRAGTVMTSRELANAIDTLVQLRVEQHFQIHHNDIRASKTDWDEPIELQIRVIADGLKRLDHNGGVAFDSGHKDSGHT